MKYKGVTIGISIQRNEICGPPARRVPTRGRYVTFSGNRGLYYRTYLECASKEEAKDFARMYVDHSLNGEAPASATNLARAVEAD